MLKDGALGLRATELEIHQSEGALVLRAPYAVLTVDTLPLLTASINPRSIELRDLQLRASVNPDGSLSFLPATEAGPERTGALADAAAPASRRRNRQPGRRASARHRCRLRSPAFSS